MVLPCGLAVALLPDLAGKSQHTQQICSGEVIYHKGCLFWQVMLRVTDLDRSIQYYTEALGMKLLRKRDNPEGKYTLAFMAYGPEEENTVIELTYNWCALLLALCCNCRELIPQTE